VIVRGDLLAKVQALHQGGTTPAQAVRCLVVLDSFLNYMWMVVLVLRSTVPRSTRTHRQDHLADGRAAHGRVAFTEYQRRVACPFGDPMNAVRHAVVAMMEEWIPRSCNCVPEPGLSAISLTRSVSSVATAATGCVTSLFRTQTAGVALIETGSGTESDLEEAFDRLLPRDDIYRHRHGSRGHGRDHVLPAFVSPSLTLPVLGGQPTLGTWQSVVLVDTNVDNPDRKVRLSFLPG